MIKEISSLSMNILSPILIPEGGVKSLMFWDLTLLEINSEKMIEPKKKKVLIVFTSCFIKCISKIQFYSLWNPFWEKKYRSMFSNDLDI